MTASGKPSLTSQTVKLSIFSVSVVFADFLLGLSHRTVNLDGRDLVLFLCETPVPSKASGT